jgi:hypothetical protein
VYSLYHIVFLPEGLGACPVFNIARLAEGVPVHQNFCGEIILRFSMTRWGVAPDREGGIG